MSFSFNTQTYWIGPYDVLVSNDIKQVIGYDNTTMIDQDDMSCHFINLAKIGNILSEDEWKAQHAFKNGDLWYYMHPQKKIASFSF